MVAGQSPRGGHRGGRRGRRASGSPGRRHPGAGRVRTGGVRRGGLSELDTRALDASPRPARGR
eukprot:1234128-Pleurochrysis_carterae.AAC.1